MRKSDLRTGMVVTTRCGAQYVLFLNLYNSGDVVGLRGEGAIIFSLDDNLCHALSSDYDITKVFKPTKQITNIEKMRSISYRYTGDYKLVWERDDRERKLKDTIEQHKIMIAKLEGELTAYRKANA